MPSLARILRLLDALPVPPRSASDRRTALRRRIAALRLPLASLRDRLRRGMVLCSNSDFDAEVRRALRRFRRGLEALIGSLPNGLRSEALLALLEEARRE